MKTFLKIIASIVGVLVIIVIGLNLYFSNERLKNIALPYINEAIDRPVQIEEMSLTFFSTFPRPGLSVEQVFIPAQTESDTLLAIEEMTASVELFSLLSDQINISEVSITHPQVQYAIYPDSSTSLDFLLQEETAQDTSAGGYKFNVPYFQITNGDIRYIDQTSGTKVRLQDLNADISLVYGDLIESTTDLQINDVSAVSEGTQWLNHLPVSLYQESTINMDTETLALREGTFSIRGLSLNLNGSIAQWSSTPILDLQVASSSDDFGQLLGLVPESYMKQVGDLETSGSLSVDGTISGPIGEEQLPEFNLSLLISEGYLKYPNVSQPVESIELAAEISNERLVLDRLAVRAGPNHFSANGTLTEPLGENRNISMDGELDFDLSTIKNFYPIDEDTLAMRGQLSAEVSLSGAADQLEQSVQSGSVQLANGFIRHQSMTDPLEDITLESTLEGPVISVAQAGFRSGKNELTISGTITNYLKETRQVDLGITGNADLNQMSNYYKLRPTVTELGGQADVQLQVTGPPANPAQLAFNGQMNVTNVNMQGEGLIQPVHDLNGQLTLSPNTATLNTLSFNLGSSDIALSGSLEDYMEYLKAEEERSTTPHLQGTYKSELLNLDELISWDDTTTSAVPIHLPDLTSSISAEIEELLVTGVTMQRLTAKASTTPEEIELQQASVNLFGGKASGSFLWKVPQPDLTNIAFSGQLDSLQAKAFFRDYQILGESSSFHEYITGAFSAEVDYATELNKYLKPVLKTSEMSGSFGMTQARLQDHPLQERLANMFNAEEFQNVALDQWQSQFTMDNSIMKFKELTLTSDDIGLELNGMQHLIKETIDYQIQLLLPGRYKEAIASVITEQAAEALTQDNGTIMIPLEVTGTHGDPKVSPDQEVIAPIIKEYLKDKAGNVLDRIFGN